MPAAPGVVRGHVVVAVKVMSSRLNEPWTLNSLAEEVHLSRSRLARAFKAPRSARARWPYLPRMRLERMARLLASTYLSVAEVARSVGWRNQFHASQRFHARYGVSPTDYRRRQTPSPLG